MHGVFFDQSTISTISYPTQFVFSIVIFDRIAINLTISNLIDNSN